jgi:hypothetical protein
MPAEDRDRYPLRNPYLKDKNSHKDEPGKKLGGIVHGVLIDRVRIQDPEQSILPAQPLEPHVVAHTQKAESCEEQEW